MVDLCGPLLGREWSNAFLENSAVGTVYCRPLRAEEFWFLGSMFALTGEREVITSLKHCPLSNYKWKSWCSCLSEAIISGTLTLEKCWDPCFKVGESRVWEITESDCPFLPQIYVYLGSFLFFWKIEGHSFLLGCWLGPIQEWLALGIKNLLKQWLEKECGFHSKAINIFLLHDVIGLVYYDRMLMFQCQKGCNIFAIGGPD